MRLRLACLLALLPLIAHAEDLGTLSANKVCLRGTGVVQKVFEIPADIFVISLRIKTGSQRGHN
jgi:hypothetical protein